MRTGLSIFSWTSPLHLDSNITFTIPIFLYFGLALQLSRLVKDIRDMTSLGLANPG
jgi:hypothetical protein